jgi:hypothetical protein
VGGGGGVVVGGGGLCGSMSGPERSVLAIC